MGCTRMLGHTAQTWACTRCALELVPIEPAHAVQHGVEALFAYEGPPAAALIRLKFGKQLAWAGPLGALLTHAKAWQQHWDAVVPIPLHARRLRQRGFNQSVELAHVALRIVGATGLLHARVLQRTRYTTPQSTLRASERAANVAGAFKVHPRAAAFVADARPRVLLVDDVVTTGSTLHAARTALMAAGASQVHALALMRADL